MYGVGCGVKGEGCRVSCVGRGVEGVGCPPDERANMRGDGDKALDRNVSSAPREHHRLIENGGGECYETRNNIVKRPVIRVDVYTSGRLDV